MILNLCHQQLQVCQVRQSMLQASGVLGSLTHGQPPHRGLWLADNMSSPAAQPGALGNGPATCHQGFTCPAHTNTLWLLGDSWLPLHCILPCRLTREHATRPGVLLACSKGTASTAGRLPGWRKHMHQDACAELVQCHHFTQSLVRMVWAHMAWALQLSIISRLPKFQQDSEPGHSACLLA